jgi:hypothetical protein
LNPPEDILSSVSFASKASGSIGQEICPQLFLNERLKAKMLWLTKACQYAVEARVVFDKAIKPRSIIVIDWSIIEIIDNKNDKAWQYGTCVGRHPIKKNNL